MFPSSWLLRGLGLWFPVYHPESTIVRRAPALTLCERVFLSPSPHTCTLCPMFPLDPSVVGLASPCTCWRKDTITRLCAWHTCVTWSAKVFLSFLLVHQAFWAWCRSCFQQPIHGYQPRSLSAHIRTSEQVLWAHQWCFCAAYLLRSFLL